MIDDKFVYVWRSPQAGLFPAIANYENCAVICIAIYTKKKGIMP